MAQHFSELDDATKTQTANLLDNANVPRNSRIKNSEFGMCAKCKSLAITRTEFQVVRAFCTAIYQKPMPLTAAHPITECNQFEDRDAPELWEMRQMAWYIDGETTRQAGFITND